VAFGGERDRGDDVVSDINMVPLIDVMMVLLIIFIITVPVLTHSVRLELPRAANTPHASRPEVITLSVTADGAVHWNGERLDEDALAGRLGEASRRAPQPEVYLRGDRRVEYEAVARVMAAVQRAGLLRLGFVTEP